MHITVVSGSLDPWTTPDRPDWSGRARHLREVVDALHGEGHQVQVVLPSSGSGPAGEVPGPGPAVHRVPLPAGSDPARLVEALAAELRRLWDGGRPDAVHAHHWTASLAARAAAEDAPLPVVQLVHAGEAEPDGPRRAVERAAWRRADGVVVTCAADRARVLAAGVAPDRLHVAPNTVDVGEYRPDGPALRRGGCPRLVALDGVGTAGGADHAVPALAGVPGVELLVAGGRPAGTPDPDRDRVFALARSHGVADRVRFLGPVGRSDVPRLLRSADVVVCAAPYWSTGTAALEAMACGRAVVSSAVGGHADVVVDDVCGISVPPRDATALARGVREALTGRCRRQALGVAGRNRVEAAYRRAHGAGALVEAFERAREHPVAG